MLPLEKQVSSLEPSQRLKELGVPQKSILYWVQKYGNKKIHNLEFGDYECYCQMDSCSHHDASIYKSELIEEPRYYSAFTTAELLEMLPKEHNNMICYYEFFKDDKDWCARTYEFSDDGDSFYDENPANALSKLAIYLLEKGLITIK